MKNLKQARREYPQGTLYYSATGNLKSVCEVQGRIYYSEQNNAIYSSEGYGVIYDGETNTWATKHD